MGVQQRVEIIKALSRDAKVLVFDEPTAVLTPQETDELMVIMRQLKEAGTSIVFITHKLREVREVADRITVIRLGKVVGEAQPTGVERRARLADGRPGRRADRAQGRAEPRRRRARRRAPDGHRPQRAARRERRRASTCARGEILAVAGVQGNGQTELTEAMLGLGARRAGSVVLDGTELVGRSVRKILESGVGFVPEDRTEDGLVGEFTIAENLMLDRSESPPFVRAGNLQRGTLADFADARRSRSSTSAPRASTTHVQRLSGGNQQKVVLARELSRDLRLFVAAQPTRGVDVGSIEFIHKRIVAARDSGVPVIVVSTELDEVAALADRIMVMYRGRIVGIVPGDTPRDVLGLMMAGEVPAEGAAA